MNLRIESLHFVESACWRELARAAREHDHDWRLMTLASTGPLRAEARNVVLRDVDVEMRCLYIYSDARTPKVAQLAAHPAATLLCWSARMAWQLRLSVQVERVHDAADIAQRWSRTRLSPSARDYLSPLAPGTPLPSLAQQAAAGTREHFAVLRARVDSIDWLELHEDGHRRARFDASGPRWLQP